MTRGKIILIDKCSDKIMQHTTCEFNGDMYLSYYGKVVINNLEKIDNYNDFRDFVCKFDKDNFGYQDENDGYFGIYSEIVKNNYINVCDNYFDNWFSDYLYFKNVSGEDITFKYEGNNEYILHNGEIGVFNFGDLYDYKSELESESDL